MSRKDEGDFRKTTYVLNRQVHFGTMKCSMNRGFKFNYFANEDGVSYAEINGVRYDDIHEIEVCIGKGFAVPYVKGGTDYSNDVRISMKVRNREADKMEVVKSDADLMEKDIDISDTKTSVIKARREEERKSRGIQVIHEDNTKTSRGMKVLYNSDVASARTDSELVNGETKVIARIGGTADSGSDSGESDESAVKSADRTVSKGSDRSREEAERRCAERKRMAMESHARTVMEEGGGQEDGGQEDGGCAVIGASGEPSSSKPTDGIPADSETVASVPTAPETEPDKNLEKESARAVELTEKAKQSSRTSRKKSEKAAKSAGKVK